MDHEQITLPLLGDLIPRGDGSFLLRPRIPARNRETWITPRDAARLLGFGGPSSVYRLLGAGLLEQRRPSPRKILISLSSVLRHRSQTTDPEFWEEKAAPGSPGSPESVDAAR